ncbi:MAG: hypothetical protein IJL40_01660, partial [Oscillospiraceae bacterium]|nr:hypothetical protein [Oscillospiraceae bacterium]
MQIYVYDFIIAGAQAELTGGLHSADGMARFHAFDQSGLAGILRIYDRVIARLVERHGIVGGENTQISHLGLMGIAVTVAVNTQ